MSDPIPMSRAARDELAAEIRRLETVERPALAEKIAAARADGDLSENAEYHAAKNDQSFLETKILKLRDQLQRAQIVEAGTGESVGHGSKVRLRNVAAANEVEYTIVAPHEADASKGLISSNSPVAGALIGAKRGDKVRVELPNGNSSEFEVLEIA